MVTQRVQVEAGHEAVLVDKPFFTIFGDGGVRSEPHVTGSKWLFYTTDVVMYDTRPVQATEGFDDDPDLVIWMFGTNDATMGVPVARYREARAQVIKLCEAHNAGLIVAGPA